MQIGTDKQLLIDDSIIEGRERIARTFHQFKRHGRQLVVPEKPWERNDFIYGSVLRDPQDGAFKMWVVNAGGRPQSRNDHGMRVQVAYFTSEDGLKWERPDLGIIEIDESKHNNVFARSVQGGYLRCGSLCFNPNAKDPAKRYVHLDQGPKGTSPSYSADGIRWSEGEPPVFQASDAATLACDPRQDRFFCFSVSLPEIRGFKRRSICMTETDLKTWREFEDVLIADEIDDAGVEARIARLASAIDYDNPDHHHAQLHHMTAFPYGSMNLGTVSVWDNTWYTDGVSLYTGGRDRAVIHLQLVWSSDPDWKKWHRLEQRIPLIELSEPGEWDCATQFPMHAPVEVGDELWLYYAGFSLQFNSPRQGGFNLPPGTRPYENGIGLATMRLDGFASLDATPRGGSFTTKPLIFKGSKLILNARALGDVTVEALDAEGEELLWRGSVAGDSVRHELASETLAKLAGKPVRLRFKMWNAQLYALQFVK